MNIFALSNSPKQAAYWQCDKHVVKMILESAQMLSTAHRMLDGELLQRLSPAGRKERLYRLSDAREHRLYKAVHYNHPCTVWTRETRENYLWLWEHYFFLCKEYTRRYHKTHKSSELLEILKTPPKNIPDGKLTPFALAMKANPECIIESDPVQSYRNYYKTKKSVFSMTWKDCDPPDWFE